MGVGFLRVPISPWFEGNPKMTHHFGGHAHIMILDPGGFSPLVSDKQRVPFDCGCKITVRLLVERMAMGSLGSKTRQTPAEVKLLVLMSHDYCHVMSRSALAKTNIRQLHQQAC